MYSLTIHFGPNAMVWSFLFRDKEKAEVAYRIARDGFDPQNGGGCIEDDFGQNAVFSGIHGAMLEDMDLVEEARIYRSLANARGEVKARQRATTDPIIRQAQGSGPQVLSPGFRQ